MLSLGSPRRQGRLSGLEDTTAETQLPVLYRKLRRVSQTGLSRESQTSFRVPSDWGCGLPHPPALGFGPSQRSILLNHAGTASRPLTTGAGPYRLPGRFITVSRPGSFQMSRGSLWESGKVQGWGRNPPEEFKYRKQ